MRLKALTEIYTIHSFAESNLKTMKSAPGKRYPRKKQSTGEETSRMQHCSPAWGKYTKNTCARHSALTVPVRTAQIQQLSDLN